MAALLDVNLLVALLDMDHLHHATATRWLNEHLHGGWASCPLTQNGCIRVMSQSAYPNHAPAAGIAARLAEATSHSAHTFWPDSVSLLTQGLMDWKNLLSGRQITDAYMLALAVANRGSFATLDQGVALSAVHGATPKHLVLLKARPTAA